MAVENSASGQSTALAMAAQTVAICSACASLSSWSTLPLASSIALLSCGGSAAAERCAPQRRAICPVGGHDRIHGQQRARQGRIGHTRAEPRATASAAATQLRTRARATVSRSRRAPHLLLVDIERERRRGARERLRLRLELFSELLRLAETILRGLDLSDGHRPQLRHVLLDRVLQRLRVRLRVEVERRHLL
eukprot:4501717-Prymnesium_polylepis.1